MILLADSGSTKTDWLVLDNKNNYSKYYNSIGLNPNFLSENEIRNHIKNINIIEKIQEIYFYGSGCGNQNNCNIIKEILQNIFKPFKIEVNSDILGAARALFNNDNGIASILGTGSNSALYNNNEISLPKKSYGYLISEYGSGASLGLNLIKSIVNNDIPLEIIEKFHYEFPNFENEIISKLYKDSQANKYLASYTKFLHRNINNERIYSIVYNSFLNFFIKNILTINNYENFRIGFVGSVAFYFSDILIKAGNHLNIKNIDILKNPIENLKKFHTNN